MTWSFERVLIMDACHGVGANGGRRGFGMRFALPVRDKLPDDEVDASVHFVITTLWSLVRQEDLQ